MIAAPGLFSLVSYNGLNRSLPNLLLGEVVFRASFQKDSGARLERASFTL